MPYVMPHIKIFFANDTVNLESRLPSQDSWLFAGGIQAPSPDGNRALHQAAAAAVQPHQPGAAPVLLE